MGKFPSPPYGKDKVAGGAEKYIEEALRGGKGPSEGLYHHPGGHAGETILTPVALDNVVNVMDVKSSILDKSFGGSEENLTHSLTGTSAVMDGDGTKHHKK
jgi:hypothetical protein